ncbi:MAG: phosphoribosylpyrophosphate synthetase [Sphingobacteriales bacterium]|nr:phosphoribosylpyrophosphate synthetase [Sphingobacteriales bacterium]
MIAYDTLSGAINGLRERGFTVDFNLGENCLVCNGDKYNIQDFLITEFYRFEGDTDPSDEAIVYAIESVNGVRGILVSGYGISAEGMSAEMARKLNFTPR